MPMSDVGCRKSENQDDLLMRMAYPPSVIPSVMSRLVSMSPWSHGRKPRSLELVREFDSVRRKRSRSASAMFSFSVKICADTCTTAVKYQQSMAQRCLAIVSQRKNVVRCKPRAKGVRNLNESDDYHDEMDVTTEPISGHPSPDQMTPVNRHGTNVQLLE
jgi:hypothetical protein